MKVSYSLLKKIIPELIELYEKRYTILRSIYSLQPVGRRSLASYLDLGERAVRSETTFLRESGFLENTPAGMRITHEGEALLEGLRDFTHQLKGLHELERQIQSTFRLEHVIVVPGNSDEDELVLFEMGKTAATYLRTILRSNSIIAVTGGSTVGAVAKALSKTSESSDIIVIPARGGIGREVEHQSNTISAIFAKKLGGQYRLLHVPDQLGAHSVETLLNEPDIKSVIELLKKADILICGIGRAEDMARRRNLSPALMNSLNRAGAVAEAFGYYFDRSGQIVFSSNSIGLNVQDLRRIPKVIGVAGGKQKAQAITAVLSHWGNGILITDEGAARTMMELAEK
jgi:central glycolytic genes regulator